jgi:hypothetical protein
LEACLSIDFLADAIALAKKIGVRELLLMALMKKYSDPDFSDFSQKLRAPDARFLTALGAGLHRAG